jgi:hypothetical protein
MAYTTGLANSFEELIDTLATVAQAQGYGVQDGADFGNVNTTNGAYSHVKILAKGDCYYRLAIWQHYTYPVSMMLTSAATSSALINGMDTGGETWSCSIASMAPPALYRIFSASNPDEIYLVIRFNDGDKTDLHRHLAFGKSSLADNLPGSGAWVSASSDRLGRESYMTSTGSQSGYSGGGIFWMTNSSTSNSFLYHGLADAASVRELSRIGPNYHSSLLTIQPNPFNQESVLLPLRAFADRPSSYRSLVAELMHARTLRIPNFESGDILQFGETRWMVFPWLRKMMTSPEGGLDHSGTLGWAIRYDGP